MVAFNFQKQFVLKIKRGEKDQTFRVGEQRADVGDMLQLYTGQRTKGCYKLMSDVPCIEVIPTRLGHDFLSFDNEYPVDGDYRHAFAVRDGFKDWDALINFFCQQRSVFPREELSMVGYTYRWKPDVVQPDLMGEK